MYSPRTAVLRLLGVGIGFPSRSDDRLNISIRSLGATLSALDLVCIRFWVVNHSQYKNLSLDISDARDMGRSAAQLGAAGQDMASRGSTSPAGVSHASHSHRNLYRSSSSRLRSVRGRDRST